MTGTANGWFQIGDGRWASGNYLSDTKPSAPAPAATSSGASSSSASSSASAPSGNALSTIAAYAAAVIDALGWEGLECDADRRAASKLGWSAGAYC